MFDKVIVGIADDQAGRDAMELARQLASEDAALTLVFVQVRVLGAAPGEDSVAETLERRRALQRLAELRDEAQLDAQLLATQARSVAAGLHEVARLGGDLLVIGASGSDDYERTFIRDDTRSALEDPPCPVAVAPTGYARRATTLRTIGVGYDASPGSERALAVARAIAHEHEADLSAFEAVREPIRIHDPWHADVEVGELVATARERIAALGGVEPHATAGDAAEELVHYGTSVDLLVLGSHKHRPPDQLMDGSIAQRVADSAPCPLLVLASSDDAADA